MGLLLSHKRTCKIRVDAISFYDPGPGGSSGGGKRGRVEGFSPQARKRMLTMLHSVKFETAVLITLTYGAEYPESWEKWKANLKEWRRRTERLYGDLRCIWRIELQKRGAPHFHLLYLDLPYIPVGQLQDLWYGILGTPTGQRFGNALDLKAVRGKDGHQIVMTYVSKYVGKVEDYSDWDEKPKIGRIWGYWNLKEEPSIECELTVEESKIVGELVRSMWAKNYYTPDDITHCTLFGEEMGSGEFMTTTVEIIRRVTSLTRRSKNKEVTFVTTNVVNDSL